MLLLFAVATPSASLLTFRGHLSRAATTTRTSRPSACARDFDTLVSEASATAPAGGGRDTRRTSLQSAVRILSNFEPSEKQTAALLDAACDLATDAPQLPPGTDTGTADGGVFAAQREQQEELTAVYEALSARGALRGFGSVSAAALLPLGITRKEISTEEQLVLTGLPTSAFAPPQGNSRSDLLLGAGSAALLATASAQLGLDVRLSIAAVGAALLADSVLFRGAVAESATRAVKPGYATTVREHEAGHFLVAYLLGCPIEACLLDVWRAARDSRFAGAAGTVFFDPALGAAMNGGRITREIIDRYSVVVMAGIAAEAAQNQRAEGGQADETALVQLLASLDGGKSWDLGRIQNQARWASSQALLLLREHGEAYVALCEALERGESVGECVVAIEKGLTSAFGRRGELPAETRKRELEARAARAAPPPAAVPAASGVVAPATGVVAPTTDVTTAAAVDERQAQIAKRLEEIKERLAREDETWTG